MLRESSVKKKNNCCRPTRIRVPVDVLLVSDREDWRSRRGPRWLRRENHDAGTGCMCAPTPDSARSAQQRKLDGSASMTLLDQQVGRGADNEECRSGETGRGTPGAADGGASNHTSHWGICFQASHSYSKFHGASASECTLLQVLAPVEVELLLQATKACEASISTLCRRRGRRSGCGRRSRAHQLRQR